MPSIIVPAPEIFNKVPSLTAKNNVVVNNAPRAGQIWDISSVFFAFPKANKSHAIEFGTGSSTCQVNLLLILNQVIVAEQIIIENISFKKVVEEAFHLVGAFEPFLPGIVYGGQSIEIEYEVIINLAAGTLKTGPGSFIINYSFRNA